ncbi:MBL fold metallo-hydrolase [Pelosinus fermentans]|uniref:Beta-lactamase domain protein n=1 Tax=Pelosinus fermentans JBW45 TaxID=1192197 RepID=I9DAQ8_9FIRM|nr:MBL fold metallo-hydrolase [Pelosinus fermentans]AJQ29075.1 beta-lactamase domain protein [Pelosinus fermentans JBW45]
MRLTILVDNTANMRDLKAESGFSLYIEDQSTKILFDTGCSALFMENAHKLGINLREADYIILSHGHYDHTWGLKHLLHLYLTADTPHSSNPILLTHPLSFSHRTKDGKNMGCNVSEEELMSSFTIHKSKTPLWISKQLVFLGEIERKFPHEGNQTIGQIIKNGIAVIDSMEDDTALAYKSSQGLVIITGCSHSGICNIVEQAKEICQDDRVLSIIGGLHLRKPSIEQLNGTITYLRQTNVRKLYACHCTDQPSRIALAQLGNLCETTVGLTLEYP